MIIAQKINFIPPFILAILQRSWKLVIPSYYGRPGHMPTKINDINLYDSLMFKSTCKKSNSSFPSFLRYIIAKTLNLLLWVLWACLAKTSKNTSCFQKTLIFIITQNNKFATSLYISRKRGGINITFCMNAKNYISLPSFLKYTKMLQTCYFE